MAEALYRKYRPQTFDDVVGQTHIERTLKNAIEADKVSHAYLFCGPRGTGKTTTARLLAKALLCEHGPTPSPDGTCQQCLDIAEGIHPDVNELDAASRTGVENVREEIIGRVQYAPTRGRYKVYIIDEVHMLSVAAFNALLKTLEEPPSHVVFILCTTDPQKVPETIHSRCQRFDFHRLSHEEIVSRLGAVCMAEGLEFEGEALDLIAHNAQGGMRDALTTLEQLAAFGDGSITLEVAESVLGSLDSNELSSIVDRIAQCDAAGCFTWIAQYVETGADLAQFTRDLAEYVRNMYVLLLTDGETDLGLSQAARQQAFEDARKFGVDRLSYILGVLGDAAHELRASTNPRLSFEIALTRMTRPEGELTIAALAARVEELERKLANGITVTAAPSVAPVTPASAAPAMSTPVAAAPSASVSVAPVPPAPVPPAPAPARVAPTAPAPVASVAPASAAQAASAAPVPAAVSTPVPGNQAVAVSAEMQAKIANAAALQRGWQGTIAELKKQRAAYGALMLSAHVMPDDSNNGIIIEFAPENTFAYNAVQKPDIMAALNQALTLVFGGPVPFSFSKGNRASGVASAPVAQNVPVAAPVPPAQTAVAPAYPAPAVPSPVAQPEAFTPRPNPVADRPNPIASRPNPVVAPPATTPAPAMPAPPATTPAPAVPASAASTQAEAAPPWEDDIVPYDDLDAAYYSGIESTVDKPLIMPATPPKDPFNEPMDNVAGKPVPPSKAHVPAPAPVVVTAAEPARVAPPTPAQTATVSVAPAQGKPVAPPRPAPTAVPSPQFSYGSAGGTTEVMDAAAIFNSLGASFEEVHE